LRQLEEVEFVGTSTVVEIPTPQNIYDAFKK